jgi:hypothetical protein
MALQLAALQDIMSGTLQGHHATAGAAERIRPAAHGALLAPAHEELGSADVRHLQAVSFRWWDGYGAYENVLIVLINEFRGSWCKPSSRETR